MVEEVYFILMSKGYRPVKVCKSGSEAFAHGELHVSTFDENGEYLLTYTRVHDKEDNQSFDETDYKIVNFDWRV